MMCGLWFSDMEPTSKLSCFKIAMISKVLDVLLRFFQDMFFICRPIDVSISTSIDAIVKKQLLYPHFVLWW
jgi:hypothetical protein